LSKKISMNKLINDIDLENIQKENLLQPKFSNLWEKNILHFTDLDPDIIHNYFIIDLDTKESQIERGLDFLNYTNMNNSFYLSEDVKGTNETSTNIENEYLIKIFEESTLPNKENFILIYELLNFLIKQQTSSKFSVVNEFLNSIFLKYKNQFYNLSSFTDFNVHILKQYLIFIYNYFAYSKTVNYKKTYYFTNAQFTEKLIEIFKKCMERANMNKTVITEEYQMDLRDCIMWVLINMNESISLTNEYIDDSNIENKKNEYKLVYENCIKIISNRLIIIKILEPFMKDSQIVSAVIRLLRKIIQILLNENNPLSENAKEAKLFAKNIKKLLITQNDAFFITTLRAILNNYSHCPEIHNNILIIITQFTTNIEQDNLVLTANKLNLKEFKEQFDGFRGKLVSFIKILNNLHLNILANLSAISKNSANEQYEDIMKSIMIDLKAFYRKNVNQATKKRIEEFKTKKLNELEIHELITRIGINVTKYPELAQSLVESYFYHDIIEFLLIMARTSENNKDFVTMVIDNRRNKEKDVKNILLSILENSQFILINVLTINEIVTENFINQVV
jgi:hypothetical protein